MILELSASLPALYAGLPISAACAAAAADGFRCVELWAAPARPAWPDTLRVLSTYDLSVTSVNCGAGEPPAFGTAADPAATAGWRAEYAETLEFGRRVGVGAINILAGPRIAGKTRETQLACLHANLEWAVNGLGDGDPSLLVEPLNGADRRSPLLHCVDDTVALLERVGSERTGLLFDAYHLYQEEPDLYAAFDRARTFVGHVQIADFPGRGEPGTGELPWESFLSHVAKSSYRGRIGCEFLPSHPGAVPVARAQLAAALQTETADVS